MGAPKTLPADFKGWDSAPATLPAGFDQWDQPKAQGMPLADSAWGRMKQAYEGTLPILDYDLATLAGVGSIARGTVGAVKGAASMLKPPTWEEIHQAAQDTGGDIRALGPAILARRTGKPLADVIRQAPQVPEAVRDINASPDPLGTYANVAQETAAQGAGQAITALGTEGAIRGAPAAARGIVDAGKSAGPAAGAALRTVSDVVSPDVTGIISPRLAHAQRVAGKIADVLAREPKPVYPGAPLPEAPAPEVLQASALTRAGQPVVDPAAALGKIKVASIQQAIEELGLKTPAKDIAARAKEIETSNMPTPESRAASDAAFQRNFPTETTPEGMTPQEKEIWQERMFGQKPSGDIGAKVRNANPEPTRAEVKAAQIKPAQVQDALEASMDVRKLKPDVPLKDQLGVISGKPKEPPIPEGHTPTDSAALRSYKYDPQANEFTAATRVGTTQYVYGDISPEDAAAFESADSKGKAWMDIRDKGTLVAKIVNGKRIPIKPARATSEVPDTGDLTDTLKKSLEAAKAKRLRVADTP